MNLAELFDRNYERFGEYESLIWLPEGEKEIRITNLDMLRESKRLAQALRDLGVERGDSIAVFLPNSPEVIVTYRAAWQIGAVAVPILFHLSEGEARYILEHSETVVVITNEDLYETIASASHGLDRLEHIILIDGERDKGVLYRDLLSKSRELPAPVDMKENETAVMIYTAGTTGKPKGVMLSHLNLLCNAMSCFEHNYFPEQEDIRTLTNLFVLPLCHSYGLIVSNLGALTGTMSVMLPRFDTKAVFRAIENYKIKSLSAVPAMYSMLLQAPEADHHDTSSMELWNSGSAPLSVELIRQFEAKFTGRIYEGYGLSEASPSVSAHHRKMKTKPGSVGAPLPGVSVRVVDYNDQDVDVNEIGELLVRGDNVMKGYYKMPEKTADVLRGGWLHTGDMARIDEEGYIFIMERKDDMIIRGGENIYPRELEEVIWSHDAVLEAAVISLPDNIMGEKVVAVVVPQSGKYLTEDNIKDFCRGKVAKFKIPGAVLVLDALPRNAIGKVLKKELRLMAQERFQS